MQKKSRFPLHSPCVIQSLLIPTGDRDEKSADATSKKKQKTKQNEIYAAKKNNTNLNTFPFLSVSNRGGIRT